MPAPPVTKQMIAGTQPAPGRPPLLLRLPVELLDLIASFVATHRDVVALALVCRGLTDVVIPAHTAYRAVRLLGRRGPTPWAHLASRPDRAAGVRSVVLFDRLGEARYIPERMPPCLEAAPPPRKECLRVKTETLLAAAGALRAMPNLHSLVFSGSLSRDTPARHAAEAAFWEAAGVHGTLRHLEYTQPLNPPAPLPKYATEVRLYPLWSISNLTTLSVKHAAFLRHAPSVVQFSRVLRSSPALESLTIEVYDWSFDMCALFHDVRFACLRALTLEIYADPACNAAALAALLERTPTLRAASWFFLDPGPLAAGALPALRALRVDVPDGPGKIGRALLPGAALEALGPLCVSPEALGALAGMRGDALRRLEVCKFDNIALLARVVRLFPRLSCLRVPAVDYWHDHSSVTPAPVHLGEWVHVLGSLPMLEVFRGVAIFRDPDSAATTEENDERAYDLLTVCPRMRRIEHWDLDPKHVILLSRDGENVSWKEILDDDADDWSTWVREVMHS
ncbi:hypothetical protein BC834DRAFT_973575 [Gloeopeniophorella convolvens]|nr:hypothetical protein BC834DRAFT_973575 [Gloeopeniophorella convolvens]